MAASSAALHLNKNSIPWFHCSSCVSPHIRYRCTIALKCLLLDMCGHRFFPGIHSQECRNTPTLPTLHLVFLSRKTVGRNKRPGPGWAGCRLGWPAWGTEEWSPLYRFQLSCQRECGYHLDGTRALQNGPRICFQQPLILLHGTVYKDELTIRIQSLVLNLGCGSVGVCVPRVTVIHSPMNISHECPRKIPGGF